MVYLGNAFSLQMISMRGVRYMDVRIEQVSAADVPVEAVSIIGHADTAAVVGSLLGRTVEMARISVTLSDEDVLYVAQVQGGRLPEGATTLPEGVAISFLKVTVSLAF